MRNDLLLYIAAFALSLVLSVGSFAGSAADADTGGIPNTYDNCIDVPNGPLAGSCSTNQDGDADGYGNACDFDFNNDGATGLDDLSSILVAVGTVDPVLDTNCDGAVGLDDLSSVLLTIGLVPGPSGLSCAAATLPGTCPPL